MDHYSNCQDRVLARIRRYDTYHDTGVTIQCIAFYCDAVSKATHCLTHLCSWCLHWQYVLSVFLSQLMLRCCERISWMKIDYNTAIVPSAFQTLQKVNHRHK